MSASGQFVLSDFTDACACFIAAQCKGSWAKGELRRIETAVTKDAVQDLISINLAQTYGH